MKTAIETTLMDNDFTLFDRLEVIKTVLKNKLNDCYLSFSGGKDSTILHYLLDDALPGNKIPRVFINTGIEYNYIIKFVKELASSDDRFVILNPTQNIKSVLETYGYPFKSKQHSHNLAIYQNSNKDDLSNLKNLDSCLQIPLTLIRYLGIKETSTLFRCPKKLLYQFSPDFNLKISDKCCLKMKKQPVRKWEKDNKKTIAIMGIRQAEGGQRASHGGCVVFDKNKNVTKFKPLNPVTDEWEDWYIEKNNIKLCELYYPPFNFKRTGCKGCPFSLNLQSQLSTMAEILPNEKKQCEAIWKPIYEEYRRLSYRLKNTEREKI